MRKRCFGQLCLALILALAAVAPLIPQVKATTGLMLDGSGFGSSKNNICSLAGKLTTTNNPDLLVALLVINDTSTTVTSVTDSASLDWTLRASQAGPSDVQIFYYYAISPRLLSSDIVTFEMNNPTSTPGSDCYAFGITGSNINSPFDPNLAMPSMNRGISTVESVSYTTENPNDLLIILDGFCAIGSGGSGPPSGFIAGVGAANAEAHTSNCPANYLQGHTYYKIVSATQASTVVTWTFNTASSSFAVIGDAIQSAPTVVTQTTVSCPGPHIVGVGGNCSVTVTDTMPREASGTLMGAIGLSLTGVAGTFTACNLVGTGDSASCSFTLTPSTAGSAKITARYLGDSTHLSSSGTTSLTVSSALSIRSFTVSPSNVEAGERVTFIVTTKGGYGGLSYSFDNMPPGCISSNETIVSCSATSSGTYHVTVTVTDHAMESKKATTTIIVGPQKVLGLPSAVGWAVIFGAIVGTVSVLIVSFILFNRRKRSHPASPVV